MAKQQIDMLGEDASCEKCNAPLSDLVVGGVGSWKNKIMCSRCFFVKTVPQSRVYELAARQYGISPEAIRLADEHSQHEYENIVLGGTPDSDLPAVTLATRWIMRRRHAAQEHS